MVIFIKWLIVYKAHGFFFSFKLQFAAGTLYYRWGIKTRAVKNLLKITPLIKCRTPDLLLSVWFCFVFLHLHPVFFCIFRQKIETTDVLGRVSIWVRHNSIGNIQSAMWREAKGMSYVWNKIQVNGVGKWIQMTLWIAWIRFSWGASFGNKKQFLAMVSLMMMTK